MVSVESSISDALWYDVKYNELRAKEACKYSKFSHKKITWVCDCGKETEKPVYSVTTGTTKACGRCYELSTEFLQSTKFGNLRAKDASPRLKGSKQKIEWVCDCGSTKSIQFCGVVSGHTTTCGQCNILKAEHFKKTRYGSLRMETPSDYLPNAHIKVNWICDCGLIASKTVGSVISGHISSCGKCSTQSAQYWKETEFGHLKMATPELLSKGSNKKVEWNCRCGNRFHCEVYAVTSGKTVRCGNCLAGAHSWYEDNQQTIRSLRTPFKKELIPAGWMMPISDVHKYMDPFQCICPLCGNVYSPIWSNIVKGSSLSCGCSTGSISFAQRSLAKFIESIGLKPELEFKIGSLKYDVGIPSKKFVIEYHGLKWHSTRESKVRDLKKAKNATDSGYEIIVIFEDEWNKGKKKIENLLRNKLAPAKPISLRPSKCEIKKVDSRTVAPLYDEFHYIGPCRGSVHYGVYYSDKLVAAASFGHPTRQSDHEYELLRMVSHSSYRVHGVWSKVASLFKSEYSPKSVVSFSDNRLFSGSVYEKIGFTYDGDIAPDYYWVKNGVRHHKSGLKKTDEEKVSGMTETQLREAQGYHKIWDLGKKRWVLKI